MILVLMANMIMPLIVGSGELISEPKGENKVLLCTSTGYQWKTIELSGTGEEISGTSEPNLGERQHCVYCLNSDDDLDAYLRPTVTLYVEAQQKRPESRFNQSFPQPAPVPAAQSPPISLYS